MEKTKRQKILISSICIILSLLVLLISCTPSFAEIAKYTRIYIRTVNVTNTTGTTLKWIKSDGSHEAGDALHYMQGSNKDSWDDVKWPIFCVAPGADIDSSDVAATSDGGKVWNSLTDDQKSAIHYALCCGYYGNNSKVKAIASCSGSESCMATQLIIWEVIKNWRYGKSKGFALKTSTTNYIKYAATSTTNKGLYKAYQYISSFMKAATLAPSFANGSTYSLKYNGSASDGYYYSLTLTDSNGVFRAKDTAANSWKWYWESDTSLLGLNLTDDKGNKLKLITNNSPQTLTIKSKGPVSKKKITFTYDYLASCKASLKSNFATSDGLVLEYSQGGSLQPVMAAANPAYISAPTASFYIKATEIEGYLNLKKASGQTDFTDDNPCYSLDNAIYVVYKDKECKEKLEELITDVNGESNTVGLPPGTYYIKEITPPLGFSLDENIYPVTVKSNETITLNVRDIPQGDPIGVILHKENRTDIKFRKENPLKGAQYEFRFYKGEYDSLDDLPDEYTRRYILKTDEYGECFVDDNHFVSGDEFYRYEGSAVPIFPLGTLVIREIKAPDGFFLDETTYIEKITTEGTDVIVNTYNTPTSDEYEIPLLTITGQKEWDDDNDRDGKRPGSITLKLLQDGKEYKTVTTSESKHWIYTFSDLPQASIDLSSPTHKHIYKYELEEVSVNGYKTETDEIKFTDNTAVCQIKNTHEIEKTEISGKKIWEDYNDCMKKRPQEITVNLYANGTFLKSQKVNKDTNWSYQFIDLPKYYDHGRQIIYTISEDFVKGYDTSYSGKDIKNTLITGSVKLIKNDGWLKGLSGVKFKLYTKDDKEVFSELKDNEYFFNTIEESQSEKIKNEYTTDNDGIIKISSLPLGSYYFLETEPKDGYMPYEGKIEFTIFDENEESLNPELTVKDNKVLMYNTGSTGNLITYIIAGIVFILAVVLLFFYTKIIKKSNKNKNKNNEEKKS